MADHDTEARVIACVREKLCADKPDAVITAETSFINDLGADSLDTVEFVMRLEEEFDIEVPDDVAEQITTVGEACDRINKLLDE